MRVLEQLEPSRVLRYFEDLCAIPHGSGHTKAISDYCVRFAKDHGLSCRQDGANNVIIVKEAAPGYESAPTVILQGHLDMVCEKIPGCTIDMEKEGLCLTVDGDLVRAEGTTLGSDDGIAVAMALAVLDDDDISHPRLEVVLTTDEEIGMLGAAALDTASMEGRIMLNLDSEEEGVFIVGCAGGVTAECNLPVERREERAATWAITVDGLTGGHSGSEIDKGRAMSNLLMGRVLYALREAGVRLVSVEGGLKDNAISRTTTAEVTCQDAGALSKIVADMEEVLQREYAKTDPNLSVRWRQNEVHDVSLMTEKSTAAAVCMLACFPQGVQVMSREIPGLVQTSLNLGILRTEPTRVTASFCVRSSVKSQKRMLVERLMCLMENLGGTVRCSGDYPAWEYEEKSPLRELMTEVFAAQYGHPPRVEVMHSGVECGLLSDKLPGLDCVSFGPELRDIHTPRENMSLSSVRRTWALTLEVLRRLR